MVVNCANLVRTLRSYLATKSNKSDISVRLMMVPSWLAGFFSSGQKSSEKWIILERHQKTSKNGDNSAKARACKGALKIEESAALKCRFFITLSERKWLSLFLASFQASVPFCNILYFAHTCHKKSGLNCKNRPTWQYCQILPW